MVDFVEFRLASGARIKRSKVQLAAGEELEFRVGSAARLVWESVDRFVQEFFYLGGDRAVAVLGAPGQPVRQLAQPRPQRRPLRGGY